MFKLNKKFPPMLVAALLVTGVVMTAAHADDDDDEDYLGVGYGEQRGEHEGRHGGENRGSVLMPAKTNAKWEQECAACHIAYAPGLLPAESWRKVMAGLDQHFGSDASLDAKSNKEITDFLTAHASNRWQTSTAPLRITESAWFKGKHNSREVSPTVWKRPSVKSASNCQACHAEAAHGNFRERDVHIPK